MQQKWISGLATGIVVLASLSLFGWSVKQVSTGKSTWPTWIQAPLQSFVGFLDLFEAAKQEVSEYPKTFVRTPEDFVPINTLEEDVTILTSYHNEENTRTVALINLRTGETLKTWTVEQLAIPQDRIVHSIMLPDSSLIYGLDWYSGLIRIDKNIQRIWHQDSIIHHHGKNLAADSTIWACSYEKEAGKPLYYRPIFKTGMAAFPYLDNHITQIHAYSGEVLYHKSLTEILVENELTHLLVKSESPGDPIHVNDIEPALHDGPYFCQGDLFISARNGSWIMHFRPSTGKVIRLLEGPFYSQHDVDIESDSTLTVFNNNCLQNERPTPNKWPMSDRAYEVGSFSSQVVRIHLNRPGFEVLDQDLWEAHEIYSFTEGEVDHLPGGGYFVEEQNSSVLWVIKEGQVRYKNVLPSHHPGYHHLANWARVMP
jgi:hypothetical protein